MEFTTASAVQIRDAVQQGVVRAEDMARELTFEHEGNGIMVVPGVAAAPRIANSWSMRGGALYHPGVRGRLGAVLVELKPGLSEHFGVDEGVLVVDVDDDAPLALQAGDVITAIDGRSVTDPAHAERILGSYDEDEEVTLSVVREGEEIPVRGTLRRVRH